MKTFQVEGVIVHEDVITTKFTCDYQVCHGGCCHVENSEGIIYEGCEINKDEETVLLSNTGIISKILAEEGRKLPKKCTYEKNGELYIKCDRKGRCCLSMSHGCALREAQRRGLLDYGNPIACHLYPLVKEKLFKKVHLKVGHYYDRFHLCDAGYTKGAKENIYLINSCKDAIVRAFGEGFFLKLQKRARSYRAALAEQEV